MRPIGEILDRMVDRLEAVQWTPYGGAAEAAFSEVKRFGWPDVPKAFEYLALCKQRVALVLFVDSQFANSRQGGKVLCRRELNVHVLCSDRVLGNIDQATFGVTTVHPGALELSRLATDALAGGLFTGVGETNDAAAIPQSETFMTVEIEGQMTGRVGVDVEYKVIGSYDSAEFGENFNG